MPDPIRPTSDASQPAGLDPQSEIGQLVARMIELLPELSENERDAAADHLADAGYVPHDSGTLSSDVVGRLCAALGLKSMQTTDPNRLAELAVLMAEFTSAVQQLTFATWKTI